MDRAILQRLGLRLHPDDAVPGAAGQARLRGWIRFIDGRAPDALACLLMADAFPPAVFSLLGLVDWVPTIEQTVHLRRRPVPGWLLGHFWSHDLSDGRVAEDGALRDASGLLLVQSRPLALVRTAQRPRFRSAAGRTIDRRRGGAARRAVHAVAALACCTPCATAIC